MRTGQMEGAPLHQSLGDFNASAVVFPLSMAARTMHSRLVHDAENQIHGFLRSSQRCGSARHRVHRSQAAGDAGMQSSASARARGNAQGNANAPPPGSNAQGASSVSVVAGGGSGCPAGNCRLRCAANQTCNDSCAGGKLRVHL